MSCLGEVLKLTSLAANGIVSFTELHFLGG